MTENDIRNMIISLLCEKVEQLELHLACAKRSKEKLEAENKELKARIEAISKPCEAVMSVE